MSLVQKGTVGSLIYNTWLLTAFLFAGCNTPSAQLTPIRSQVNAVPVKQNAQVATNSHDAMTEAVMMAYYTAWKVPNGVPQGSVKAIVTIAKDGKVFSAQIVQPSGIAALDRSVQKALDNVVRVPSLKTGLANQPNQFSVVINFRKENRGDAESLDWPLKTSPNAKP